MYQQKSSIFEHVLTKKGYFVIDFQTGISKKTYFFSKKFDFFVKNRFFRYFFHKNQEIRLVMPCRRQLISPKTDFFFKKIRFFC